MTFLIRFVLRTFARRMPRTFIATVIVGLLALVGWLGAASEQQRLDAPPRS